MKAENVRIQYTIWHPICEPDAMNNTSVSVDGEVLWPFPDDEEITEECFPLGSVFKLEIPSGVFEGDIEHTLTVQDTRGSHLNIEIRGTWQGRAGGLAGGLSGLGDFLIINECSPKTCDDFAIVTESSTLPQGETVSLVVYEAVRELAGCLETDPYKKQTMMAKVFTAVGETEDSLQRLNSQNQITLYQEVLDDLGLEYGDMVFLEKNSAGRWELWAEDEALAVVKEAWE